MSIKVSVEVKGLKEALRDIRKYNDRVQESVSDAIRNATYDVRNRAVEFAPVNKKIGLGGNLRRGIVAHHRGLQGFVEARAKYAAFVEYGTGRRGAGSGVAPPPDYSYGPRAGMRAQPYMWPAVEAARPAFFAALKRALKK